MREAKMNVVLCILLYSLLQLDALNISDSIKQFKLSRKKSQDRIISNKELFYFRNGPQIRKSYDTYEISKTIAQVYSTTFDTNTEAENITEMPTVDLPEIDNHFFDPLFLLNTGTHGLSFEFLGQALIFEDYWDNYFVIKLPFSNLIKPSEDLGRLNCTYISETITNEEVITANVKSTSTFTSSIQFRDYIFTEPCKSFEKQFNAVLNMSKDVTLNAIDNFYIGELERVKREIVTIATIAIIGSIIAGGAAGWVASKHSKKTT